MPDRQPRRLQHLPRGARPRAPDVRPVRLRDASARTAARLGSHAAVPRRHLRDNPAGRLRGIDLNRNYGGLLGRPRARARSADDTYRGDGPFSEPEVAEHPRARRDPPDHEPDHQPHLLEPRPAPAGRRRLRLPARRAGLYQALGADAGGPQRLREQPGYQLYDTTGATEDWSYWTAGGLGFTFEIGPTSSIRRTRRASSPSTSAAPPPRAPARAATARPTTRCSRPRRTRRSTPVSAARRRPARGSRLRKTFQTSTSPVWQHDLGHADRRPDPLRRTRSSTRSRRPRGASPGTSTRPPGPWWPAASAATPPARRRRRRRCPTRPACRPRTPGDPLDGAQRDRALHRAGAGRRRRQRDVHRPREWTNPATDWDVYVLDAEGAVVAASAGAAGHDRGRGPLRPAARRVPGRPRGLRPGRRPAVRRVDRLGELRRPAAHHARGVGELDAHVHPGGRDAGSRRRGRGGPRRASARSATSVRRPSARRATREVYGGAARVRCPLMSPGIEYPWEAPLGAVPTADGRTRFRVWAPRAGELALERGGARTRLEPQGHGVFAAELPGGAGQDYAYVVDGARLPDPCSPLAARRGCAGRSRVLDTGGVRVDGRRLGAARAARHGAVRAPRRHVQRGGHVRGRHPAPARACARSASRRSRSCPSRSSPGATAGATTASTCRPPTRPTAARSASSAWSTPPTPRASPSSWTSSTTTSAPRASRRWRPSGPTSPGSTRRRGAWR